MQIQYKAKKKELKDKRSLSKQRKNIYLWKILRPLIILKECYGIPFLMMLNAKIDQW
jgi:hypothetical protein